jgi:hypothetical protein
LAACLALLAAAASLSCSFGTLGTRGSASTAEGTVTTGVSICVPALSPALAAIVDEVETGSRAAGARAYFGATSARVELYKGDEASPSETWTESVSFNFSFEAMKATSSSVLCSINFTHALAAGSYRIKLAIINSCNGSDPLAAGDSGAFTVKDGELTSVTVTCKPLQAKALALGTASDVLELKPYDYLDGTMGSEAWFSFTANSGFTRIAAIPEKGSAAAPSLAVFDSAGKAITKIKSSKVLTVTGIEGYGCSLVVATVKDATYYVGVADISGTSFRESAKALSTSATRGFRLAASDLAEDSYGSDGTYTTATEIKLGDIQRHSLLGPTDEDWVQFTATKGKKYDFIATSPDGTSSSIGMYLYNTDGTTSPSYSVRKLDPNELSRIVAWTCAADGTYYVRLSTSSSSGYGSLCDLKVLENKSPANLAKVQAADKNQNTLSWDAVTEGTAVSYRLYRWDTISGYGDRATRELIHSGDDRTYTDTVASGGMYTYYVSAVIDGVESELSAPAGASGKR